MGALVSSLWRQQPREVIVIGLDAAGKTTMLQSMKNTQGGQIQTHVPTVGFLLETLDFQGSAKFLTMKAWDVGGRTFIRPLLRHWFTKTDGIIFVLDSTDRERFEDARFELHRVLGEEALHGKPLLVLANKQDLPAANITEVVEKLGLHSLRHRMWFIQDWVNQSPFWVDSGFYGAGMLPPFFVRKGGLQRNQHLNPSLFCTDIYLPLYIYIDRSIYGWIDGYTVYGISHAVVMLVVSLPSRRLWLQLAVVCGMVWIGWPRRCNSPWGRQPSRNCHS